MTDNEMVEKYTEVSVNEYKDSLVDIDDIDILREAIAEAYLTGLKIGRQEKWHDLKKSPQDLPKEKQEVLVFFTLPDKSKNDVMIAEFENNDFNFVDLEDVIAWCEIPKYPVEFDYSEWHYIKDGVLPNTEFGRVDVTVAYINAYENPCKMDCCFDGTDFIYWNDRKPIGWKKVDIFGKIYAWKYQEKLPEPPKESEK